MGATGNDGGHGSGHFYLIAPMIFPWFTEARNLISVVSHVMFGVVLAGAYVAMRRR